VRKETAEDLVKELRYLVNDTNAIAVTIDSSKQRFFSFEVVEKDNDFGIMIRDEDTTGEGEVIYDLNHLLDVMIGIQR
jgi:hypothetical protein